VYDGRNTAAACYAIKIITFLVCGGRSFPVLLDDVDDAGVDAGDQPEYAERDDEHVLPQAPVESAEARVVPVRDQVDAAGQDQAQERQTQRAHQRYDRAQVGHGDGGGH